MPAPNSSHWQLHVQQLCSASSYAPALYKMKPCAVAAHLETARKWLRDLVTLAATCLGSPRCTSPIACRCFPKTLPPKSVACEGANMLPQLRPLKHCLLITLWADGHSVQCLTPDGEWLTILNPIWGEATTYSILLSQYRLISAPTGTTLEPITNLPQKGTSNGTT